MLLGAKTPCPTLLNILFSTPCCSGAAPAADSTSPLVDPPSIRGLNENGEKFVPHKPSSKTTTALLLNRNIFISLMTL